MSEVFGVLALVSLVAACVLFSDGQTRRSLALAGLTSLFFLVAFLLDPQMSLFPRS